MHERVVTVHASMREVTVIASAIGTPCTGEINPLYCIFPLWIILPFDWLSRQILVCDWLSDYYSCTILKEGLSDLVNCELFFREDKDVRVRGGRRREGS